MGSEIHHCVVFTEVHSKPVRPVLVIIHSLSFYFEKSTVA